MTSAISICENEKKQTKTITLMDMVDKDIITARAFPRDVRTCMKNIDLTISMSPEVAASCYYTVPRAGKTITGASIRLAEICASFWGNMQSGTRVISNNGKSVVVEGWCLDLETNAKVSHEISRGIVTKDGKPYNTDMQNITIAAASAIAFRNVIFKTIPKVFIDQALQKAMTAAVMTKGHEEFEKKRQNMFESLEHLGVSLDKVFAFFNKTSIQDFDLEDMKTIYGVRTAIKEGIVKAENAFSTESNTDAEEETDNTPALLLKKLKEKQQKNGKTHETLLNQIKEKNVSDTIVKKWLTKAQVDEIKLLSEEQANACLNWIEKNSEKVA